MTKMPIGTATAMAIAILLSAARIEIAAAHEPASAGKWREINGPADAFEPSDFLQKCVGQSGTLGRLSQGADPCRPEGSGNFSQS